MTTLSPQVHVHKMNRKTTYTLSAELGSWATQRRQNDPFRFTPNKLKPSWVSMRWIVCLAECQPVSFSTVQSHNTAVSDPSFNPLILLSLPINNTQQIPDTQHWEVCVCVCARLPGYTYMQISRSGSILTLFLDTMYCCCTTPSACL